MNFLLNLLRSAAAVCVLSLLASSAYAMDTLPTVPRQDVPSPTGVPIDGGASLLLASGAAYAVRRIRAAKR
ncbi:hypothetical protein HHL22_02785 [Hymenobacter sp. RP-2-7]|uniref:VPDSG-CTERM sorting domain-containing protein n=1 Tax=Hymenobacter polaris TaxID=2682546 RepID=A0A7Y0FKV3_9BACT|nr:hypothetical protein [Hymenobacter polaris]